MTRAIVPLAHGVEEMEAVIIIDTLRRAKWQVVAVGLSAAPIVASRGVRLNPDAEWPVDDAENYDALILPGGAVGAATLAEHAGLLKLIRHFDAQSRLIGAVCAGPTVLQAAGILDGRRITSHPTVADALTSGNYVDDRVATDGHIITSRGPGTTFAFALTLVRLVNGDALATELAQQMLVAESVP